MRACARARVCVCVCVNVCVLMCISVLVLVCVLLVVVVVYWLRSFFHSSFLSFFPPFWRGKIFNDNEVERTRTGD